MISEIRGEIWGVEESKGYVSLTVGTGGVGWHILSTPEIMLSHKTGEKIKILTHTVVKEDAIELYGFVEKKELEFFRLLISISGIGPKKALSILSVTPSSTLTRAIKKGDASYLTQVSGIGRKNAEKIVLELREKIDDFNGDDGDLREESDAIEAIRALGYSTQEARLALRDIDPKVEGISGKVKAALKSLGKKKI